MAKTFHLTIASVGENLFDGQARSLTAPGTEGTLTVLAQHEPLVTSLEAGTLRVEGEDGQVHSYELPAPDILEISSNQATVIM